MLGGADNPNGELPSYITGADSRSWRANWPNVATFFVYPEAICKVIYTTNAIESLNSVIRHAIKKWKEFPTDESVKKVVWLAI